MDGEHNVARRRSGRRAAQRAVPGHDLDSATIPALRAAMSAGELTAVALAEAYLERIARLDPQLHAVLAVHPRALDDARAADERRRAGRATGALDGIPVLVKDNIAVSDLPTTAGSRALADSAPPDAPLVTRLRAAGAVILGKANLSEWANFRSTNSTSGWSALGGQCRNPHALDRSPCGSSSGSAAAVAASLAQVAIGTETDGSITAPASVCGVVGLKPTRGAVPGAGVVPISSAQDTAGPLARHVVDAAITHAALAGTDPVDLSEATLAGTNVGVWRPDGSDAQTDAVLDATLTALGDAGAQLGETPIDPSPIGELELAALYAEFHHEIDAYLRAAPGNGPRNLAELIAFNKADGAELAHFGQEHFAAALAAPSIKDRRYRAQRAQATKLARDALDAALRTHDAILTLTTNPAWLIDYAAGDDYHIDTAGPAAVAGYPAISLPAGFAGALPVGITLIGRPRADTELVRLAYAVERTHPARRPPDYLTSTG